jgi:hypothetical protein
MLRSMCGPGHLCFIKVSILTYLSSGMNGNESIIKKYANTIIAICGARSLKHVRARVLRRRARARGAPPLSVGEGGRGSSRMDTSCCPSPGFPRGLTRRTYRRRAHYSKMVLCLDRHNGPSLYSPHTCRFHVDLSHASVSSHGMPRSSPNRSAPVQHVVPSSL